jgi:serine/threonine protein kinase
LDKDLVDL